MKTKRPYRAFRTKRLEVQAARREPRHIREGRSKGKRRKAQRNRRRVSKSNHQAARAEISPPPLDNNIGGTDNEIQKASECRVLFKVCPRRWKVHDYKC